MSAGLDADPNTELQALIDSKRIRRAAFVAMIQRAGMNPANVDVTTVMSDEQAAEVIRQAAIKRECQAVAERTPRRELQERLRRVVAENSAAQRRSTQEIDTNDVRKAVEEMLEAQRKQRAEAETPPSGSDLLGLNGTNGAHGTNGVNGTH